MHNTMENTAAAIDSHIVHSHDMEEVEKLTHEIKRLLVNHEHAIDEEGLRHEIETLERWLESYRRGLSAANKISKTGVTWLHDMRDRLKLAADEMHRFEGEGGNMPATREQMEKSDEMRRAVHHIDELLPSIEEKFSHLQEKTEAL